MEWMYEDSTEFEIPDEAIGFVYILLYDNDTKAYIGKKEIRAKKTLVAKKNGIPRPGATRITRRVLKDEKGHIMVTRKEKEAARKRGLKGTEVPYDVIYIESSWRNYESSSKDVSKHKLSSKKILQWAYSKKHLSYLENKWLYKEGVLETNDYLNKNIGGTYFSIIDDENNTYTIK
jgi:hypothetical protein